MELAVAKDGSGHFSDRILGFARLLRSTGLLIGSQKVADATEAVLAAGLESRETLYWTLHSVFVSRPSEREIFDQAFQIIWWNPSYADFPASPPGDATNLKHDAMARRLAESLLQSREELTIEREVLERFSSGTASELEVLGSKDFSEMTADELRLARRVIAELLGGFAKRSTRRFFAIGSGQGERLDVRRMLRTAGARGFEAVRPIYKKRSRRAPPLVVLCDISGSMDSYARIFLHFLYALINEGERVHAFLFGTRLTNVTRLLRDRDPDAAIAKVSREVEDWSGGTRIGDSLRVFNNRWARRVLGQSATVLLITDGLDRSGGEGIAREARRLRGSARRVIWLNPLMRFEGYAPLAAGAAKLVPHVTDLRPCHNLRTIADLAIALAERR